jgi:hypothetical protein
MVVLDSDLLQSKNIWVYGLLLILAFYVLILFYIALGRKKVILNGQLIRISIRFP